MIFSPATCKGRTTISFNLQYILSKFTKFVNKTYANGSQGYIKYVYLIKNYTYSQYGTLQKWVCT